MRRGIRSIFHGEIVLERGTVTSCVDLLGRRGYIAGMGWFGRLRWEIVVSGRVGEHKGEGKKGLMFWWVLD